MILYDWIAARGRRGGGALTRFRARLATAQQAQLDAYLLMVEDIDDVASMPNLVGPIRDGGRPCPHIYKLQIGGKVRLRPLLCRGPMGADDKGRVLTFLKGAKEVGDRFRPRNAPQKAVSRRADLLAGAATRERLRVKRRRP